MMNKQNKHLMMQKWMNKDKMNKMLEITMINNLSNP
jgi:hypothetical protein